MTRKERAAHDRREFVRRAPGVMAALMRDFPGLDIVSAAAILGNLGAESRLQAVAEENPTVAGSRGGFGWSQSTGPRRRAAEAFWAKRNMDPSTDAAQYAWLFYELKHTSERRGMIAVMRPGTLEEKVRAFEAAFERAGLKNYAGRYSWARLALQSANTAPVEAPVEPGDPQPEPVERKWAEDHLAVFEVRSIQERLKAIGLGHILGKTGPKKDGVDGSWGPLTAAAILALQTRKNITTDGHWGPQTKQALAEGFEQPEQPKEKEVPMFQSIALGMVRHALTGAAAVLVGKGVLDAGAAEAIVGGLLAAASVAWSTVEKLQRPA